MEKVNRKLFLSLKGLLKAIAEARVTTDELYSAMFYLGVTRGKISLTQFEMIENGQAGLARFVGDVFLRAQTVGRVRWTTSNEKPSYIVLNFMLVDQGYKELRPTQYYNFTAAEVTRLMAESNPDVEVVP